MILLSLSMLRAMQMQVVTCKTMQIYAEAVSPFAAERIQVDSALSSAYFNALTLDGVSNVLCSNINLLHLPIDFLDP